MPWNFHEVALGEYDFTVGMRNIGRFLSLAQEVSYASYILIVFSDLACLCYACSFRFSVSLWSLFVLLLIVLSDLFRSRLSGSVAAILLTYRILFSLSHHSSLAYDLSLEGRLVRALAAVTVYVCRMGLGWHVRTAAAWCGPGP